MMRVKIPLLAALLVLGGSLASATSDGLNEVKELVAKGRSERALGLLETFLVGQPLHLEGQFLRGVLLVETKRAGDAERAFRILAGQFPERPEPAHNLAVLTAASGRRATAIALLEDIVARFPSYETAAVNLAQIRQGLGASDYDPMDPESTQVQLVLTTELGSYPRVEPASQPRAVAAAAEPAPQPEPEGAVAAETEVAPADAELEPTAAAPAPAPAGLEAEMTPASPPAEPAASPRSETITAKPVPEATPKPAAEQLRPELERAVATWAASWSQQRIKEYLGAYAADFQPTGYSSREAWERVRRQRVAEPAFIEVEVDFETLTLRETDTGEASVTFVQHYRSDRFSDTVEKTLDLVREDGVWRIRRENSN